MNVKVSFKTGSAMNWYIRLQRFFRELIRIEEQQSEINRLSEEIRLRNSLHGYFKHEDTGMELTIAYDMYSHQTIENIRRDGWKVQLELTPYGSLCYTVYGRVIKRKKRGIN